MKHNLFLCNTFFQLINAIQLKMTVFKKDDSILVLSDHSKNAQSIAGKLKSLGIFRNVYYIKTHYICGEYIAAKNKIPCIIDDIKGNLYGINLENKRIDRLFYYNDNHASLAVYAALYSINKDVECIRFEEGIGSYILEFHRDKKTNFAEAIRKLCGKKCLYEETRKFFCYQPDLYPGKLESCSIPFIRPDSEAVNVLKRIFFEPGTDYSIRQKYIFFGSPYDQEGGCPIEEFELVKKIAELVGYDNLIVKAHPRVFTDEYTDIGISFYEHSAIPWEVLQLVMDFSDKVFLTAVSSSVMSLNMTLENPIKTFYLYRLTKAKENRFARITPDMFDKFTGEFSFHPEKYNIHIADSLEEILE